LSISKESYLKHKDVIDAWANGAEIQFRSFNSDIWLTINGDPYWASAVDYRVKPAPRVPRVIYVNEYSPPKEWAVHHNKSVAASSAAKDATRKAVKYVEIIDE
jgi:hypothetical protein